jgi:hypothetical protein
VPRPGLARGRLATLHPRFQHRLIAHVGGRGSRRRSTGLLGSRPFHFIGPPRPFRQPAAPGKHW